MRMLMIDAKGYATYPAAQKILEKYTTGLIEGMWQGVILAKPDGRFVPAILNRHPDNVQNCINAVHLSGGKVMAIG